MGSTGVQATQYWVAETLEIQKRFPAESGEILGFDSSRFPLTI